MKSLEKAVKEEIAKRILYLIGENDVTGFAKSIGVSRNNVNDWIRGKADIRIGDVIDISKKYGKSVDWILGLVPKEKDSNVQEVQIASDYTGLDHEAVELLHLHAIKEGYEDRIKALNLLLNDVRFYFECLPALGKYLRYLKAIPGYNWRYDTSEFAYGEKDTITLDPEAAACYFAHNFSFSLEEKLKEDASLLSQGEDEDIRNLRLENAANIKESWFKMLTGEKYYYISAEENSEN